MLQRLIALVRRGRQLPAATKALVLHRVFNQPYVQSWTLADSPMRLWNCLFIDLAATAPVRATVTHPDMEDPVLLTIINVRTRETVKLLALHGAYADRPLRLRLESRRPFTAYPKEIFMLPAFERIDGMIVYKDPRFPSHPESEFFGRDEALVQRKLGLPGRDVAY